jgi:hypothetical protein
MSSGLDGALVSVSIRMLPPRSMPDITRWKVRAYLLARGSLLSVLVLQLLRDAKHPEGQSLNSTAPGFGAEHVNGTP